MTDEYVECAICEMFFSVVFNRNPVYAGIEYCPFCGNEWEQASDANA